MVSLEDCLELAVGIKENTSNISIDIKKEDEHILSSIARQVCKGIAFTDRQKLLVEEKLLEYKDDFDTIGIDLTSVKDTLRLPLREIDRSKWIKLLEHNNQLCIAVRFTFNKKLLQYIEPVKRLIHSDYDRINKIHYFPYSPKNVYLVINSFKNADFEIEERVLEIYQQCCDITQKKESFIPGVYDYELKNINVNTVQYILNNIGTPNQNNLYLFYDRRHLYGINHFNKSEVDTSYQYISDLTQKIISRKTSNVVVDKTVWSFGSLVTSIDELERFPLLVVLPEQNSLEYLQLIYSAFIPYVSEKDQSVLFRHENDGEGQHFNIFVKNKSLNNKVDTNTKIVYINNNKLPKPLIKMDFRPLAMLLYPSSRLHSKLQQYSESLDLIMHYDKDATVFVRDIDKI